MIGHLPRVYAASINNLKGRRVMKKVIGLCSIVLLLVPFAASAQVDFCEGNFDYDQDVDGSDAFTFKADFGRSGISNPCPPDGPSPVQKRGREHLFIYLTMGN